MSGAGLHSEVPAVTHQQPSAAARCLPPANPKCKLALTAQEGYEGHVVLNRGAAPCLVGKGSEGAAGTRGGAAAYHAVSAAAAMTVIRTLHGVSSLF